MQSFDVFNEQIVLGSALADEDCFVHVVSKARPEDFLLDRHRAIADGLSACLANNLKPDLDTVLSLATASHYDGGNDLFSYLQKIKTAYSANANLEHHIKKLKIDAVKHKISTESLPAILKAASDPRSALADVMAELDNASGTLYSAQEEQTGFVQLSDMAEEYEKHFLARKDTKIIGTGFEDVDKHLGEGFVPQNISIIGAFSGVGKSTMIVNMMRRQARMGLSVALYSLEMKRFSVMDLFNSMESGIPLTHLTRPPLRITQQQIDQVVAMTKRRQGQQIFINDRASLSISQIASEIRRFQNSAKPLDIVYIDLFGKVEEVDTGDHIAAMVQRELKHLRQIARGLKVHFCLATQLNRESQARVKGKVVRPQIRHIKNSNAYQEEADLVFLLHRTKHYDPTLVDDIMEINIAKQRMGVSGKTAFLEYVGEVATLRPTNLIPEDIRNNEHAESED